MIPIESYVIGINNVVDKMRSFQCEHTVEYMSLTPLPIANLQCRYVLIHQEITQQFKQSLSPSANTVRTLGKKKEQINTPKLCHG